MKIVLKQLQKHAGKHIAYLDIEDDGEILFSKSVPFLGDEKEFSERLKEKIVPEIENVIREKKELAEAAEKVQNILDEYNEGMKE